MKNKRIILDENFSDSLAVALRNIGYNVVSVHETEWAGFKNGAQVRNAVFIRRFIKALETEGLPKTAGEVQLWPQADFNND